MTQRAGKQVGAYELVELLGEGRVTTVFKAYHRALDRHVALKMLRVQLDPDSEQARQFQKVARRVAALEHPNIVPIHDFAEHNGVPYLVQKLVEGESLKARLEHGPLALPEASRMMGAAGSALQYAHAEGQAHGALTPGNILLGNNGTVYVTDFGAGAASIGESGTTYRSPEQWQTPGLEDAASDQYSLGLILFEALTGVLPAAASAERPGARPITRELPRPSALNPALNPAIDEAVLTALARNPARRYPDVRTMVLAFQRVTAPPRPATAPLRIDEATQPLAASVELDSLRSEIANTGKGITIMLAMPGGHVFRLTGRQAYIVGRADPTRNFMPELDLSDWHALESGVSRQHGRFHFENARLYFTDHKSANGSSVNGARLSPSIPMLLEDGDELGLGKLTFRVYFGNERALP